MAYDENGKDEPEQDPVENIDVGVDYVLSLPSNLAGDAVIIPDVQSVADSLKEREKFVDSEKLYKSIRSGERLDRVADLVIIEIAEELSNMKFERKKAAIEGRGTMSHTVSRINSLKVLADVVAKKLDAAKADAFDLRSPKFQKILSSWLEFVYDSMKKVGYDDKNIDIVFNQLKADMLDWERKIMEMSK